MEVFLLAGLFGMLIYILNILKSRFDKMEDAIQRHNNGLSTSSKRGRPWKIVYCIACNLRSEAVLLETKIKKRGAKRYLEDIDFKYEA